MPYPNPHDMPAPSLFAVSEVLDHEFERWSDEEVEQEISALRLECAAGRRLREAEV